MCASNGAAKNERNLAKHGIDFEFAARVFLGRTLTVLDQRHDYGEDRYRTIGEIDGVVYFVAWTPRGDIVRIISARTANAKEDRSYRK